MFNLTLSPDAVEGERYEVVYQDGQWRPVSRFVPDQPATN